MKTSLRFARSERREEGWASLNNSVLFQSQSYDHGLKIYEILQRDQFLPHGFKGHGTSPSHRRLFFRPPSPQAQSWALPQVERLLSAPVSGCRGGLEAGADRKE